MAIICHTRTECIACANLKSEDWMKYVLLVSLDERLKPLSG